MMFDVSKAYAGKIELEPREDSTVRWVEPNLRDTISLEVRNEELANSFHDLVRRSPLLERNTFELELDGNPLLTVKEENKKEKMKLYTDKIQHLVSMINVNGRVDIAAVYTSSLNPELITACNSYEIDPTTGSHVAKRLTFEDMKAMPLLVDPTSLVALLNEIAYNPNAGEINIERKGDALFTLGSSSPRALVNIREIITHNGTIEQLKVILSNGRYNARINGKVYVLGRDNELYEHHIHEDIYTHVPADTPELQGVNESELSEIYRERQLWD